MKGASASLRRLRFSSIIEYVKYEYLGGALICKLLQTVVVKQVLTEKSKEKLHEKYHTKILQLQKECDQLRFEMKKLEKNKKFHQRNLTNHFEKEIQNTT